MNKIIIVLLMSTIYLTSYAQNWEIVTPKSPNGCYTTQIIETVETFKKSALDSEKYHYDIKITFENNLDIEISFNYRYKDNFGESTGRITLNPGETDKVSVTRQIPKNSLLNIQPIEASKLRYLNFEILGKQIQQSEYINCLERFHLYKAKKQKEIREKKENQNNSSDNLTTSNKVNNFSNAKSKKTNSSKNNTPSNTSNDLNNLNSTPQSRLNEYQKITENHSANLRQQEAIDKAYQDDISNAFSQAIDNNGNINASNFINSLPTATTKTQAYSNLIMSGTAILGQVLQSITSKKELRQQEIANRRIQLKDGIGKYNSENKKTGHWTYFYMNTTAPKFSGRYKNGKRDGIWEFYSNQEYDKAMDKIMTEVIVYKNGEIKQKYKAKNATYSITKETGLFSRKQNFTQQKGNYIIDSQNIKRKYGFWEEYNDYGVNISQGYYNILGKETGVWYYGYEYQKNGIWFTRSYHLLRKVSYNNGKPFGEDIRYHFNGSIGEKNIIENNVVKKIIHYDLKGKETGRTNIDDFFGHISIIRTEEGMNHFKNNINDYLNKTTLQVLYSEIDSLFIEKTKKLPNLKEFIFTSLSNKDNTLLLENVFTVSKLESLNFTSNELQVLPISVRKLKYLNELTLNRNNLTKLPKELTTLQKLSNLQIVNNNLEQLPEQFGNLYNLKKLNLSGNSIKKLSNDFNKLSNLESLDLSYNLIEKLPQNFGNLTNLKKLILTKNKITKLPESFSKLINLKKLVLTKNQITELPENFSKLINLEFLLLDEKIKNNSKKVLKDLKKNNKNITIKFK